MKYCQAHECKENGCYHEAEHSGGFCQSHVCSKGDCDNRRAASSSAYCTGHQCNIPGCFAAATVMGGYCDTEGHACSERGCPEMAISRRSGTPRCEDHLILDAVSDVSTRLERLRQETEQREREARAYQERIDREHQERQRQARRSPDRSETLSTDDYNRQGRYFRGYEERNGNRHHETYTSDPYSHHGRERSRERRRPVYTNPRH